MPSKIKPFIHRATYETSFQAIRNTQETARELSNSNGRIHFEYKNIPHLTMLASGLRLSHHALRQVFFPELSTAHEPILMTVVGAQYVPMRRSYGKFALVLNLEETELFREERDVYAERFRKVTERDPFCIQPHTTIGYLGLSHATSGLLSAVHKLTEGSELTFGETRHNPEVIDVIKRPDNFTATNPTTPRSFENTTIGEVTPTPPDVQRILHAAFFAGRTALQPQQAQ